MFIRKSKYLTEKLIANQRIAQLEDIICPAQSHKWKKLGFSVVDEHGTVVYAFVCENCRKIKKDLHDE